MNYKGTFMWVDGTEPDMQKDFDAMKPLGATDKYMIIKQREEDCVGLSGGMIISLSCCRGVYKTEVQSATDLYHDAMGLFEDICVEKGYSDQDYMKQDAQGAQAFGEMDYYVGWKIDEGYKVAKKIQIDEDAVIIGSSKSELYAKGLNYMHRGYAEFNVDWFDLGVTASGKFFVVQNGQVQYMNAAELETFLWDWVSTIV